MTTNKAIILELLDEHERLYENGRGSEVPYPIPGLLELQREIVMRLMNE